MTALATQATSGSNSFVYFTTASTTATSIVSPTATRYTIMSHGAAAGLPERLSPVLGQKLELNLPDGGKFTLEKDGSYKLEDDAARVTYAAARHREFNRYLNASDLIEEFIGEIGGLGIKKGEILKVPMSAFIAFLVVKAAEADGEEPPAVEIDMIESARDSVLLLPAPIKKPKCCCCGRFIARSFGDAGLAYCSDDHAAAHFRKRRDSIAKVRDAR